MKNKNNKLEGIWVPLEILKLEDLSMSEKVILAVIEALDNKNGCFASNDYIAKVLGVKARRISAAISSLKEKGYVTVEIENNNARTVSVVKEDLAEEVEEVEEVEEECQVQEDIEDSKEIMKVKGIDLSNITADALYRLVHRVEDVKVWLKNLPMKYVKTEWKDIYKLAFSI